MVTLEKIAPATMLHRKVTRWKPASFAANRKSRSIHLYLRCVSTVDLRLLSDRFLEFRSYNYAWIQRYLSFTGENFKMHVIRWSVCDSVYLKYTRKSWKVYETCSRRRFSPANFSKMTEKTGKRITRLLLRGISLERNIFMIKQVCASRKGQTAVGLFVLL